MHEIVEIKLIINNVTLYSSLSLSHVNVSVYENVRACMFGDSQIVKLQSAFNLSC